MSNNTQFGADLKIGGQDTSVAAEQKVAALRQATIELADSFTKGEISQQEFSAALKELNAELRTNEQAARILATARREQAQVDRDAAEAAEAFLASQAAAAGTAAGTTPRDAQTAAAVQALAAERELAAATHEVAMANAELNATLASDSAEQIKIAETHDLATSSELAAMAIEHEIEMLRFEAESLKTGAIQLGNYTITTHGAASAHGKLDTAVAGASRGMRNWGQSALIASQGLEDVQYGMGGLINNIPYFVMSLGGPMGVAAAISVTAVGAFQLYKHWDTLTNIFEEKKPFPKAANDLVGLNEQLDKTKKELEELSKLGTITISQETRVAQLRQAERDIKETIETKQTIDRLGKAKSKDEEEVAKAFEEALKESGAKEQLAALQKDVESSANPAVKGSYLKIVKSLTDGNVEAYDALLNLLRGQANKGGAFAAKLQSLRKEFFTITSKDMVNQDAAADFEDEMAATAREQAKEFTKQGLDLQGQFLRDMGDEARKGISEGIGGRLKDILVRTRAEGSKGAKEVKYLTDAIAEELTRMMPQLARFPTMVANLAREMARTLQDEVNKAIDELMKLEGLTKQEALRRLNQQRAEKGQEKTEALASDAFKQAAAAEARRNARLDPTAAPATPQSIAARAAEMQGQLKELGVTPKQQVEIGKLLNDPRAARLVPGAMGAMQDRGFGEAQAMRALPEFFRQLKGGQAGIERAADRLALAAERAEHAAFQRATLQQTAVPRPRTRAPVRPKARNLPNTALDLSMDPERGRARNAERDRLIKAQTDRDAKRNAPKESTASKAAIDAKSGPQANLAPAVAGTQAAVATTQQATAANTTIIAQLNATMRQLQSNARQLVTRASESQPSASTSGGNVA